MDRGSSRCACSRFARLAALICALLAVGAVGAGSASALVIRTASGRAFGYVPLRGAAPLLRAAPQLGSGGLLVYHGGPVMTSNTNYAFYWAPAGSTLYPAEYQSGIDEYFEQLAHDSGGTQNVDSVSAQYTNSSGEHAAYNSHFAGEIIDTDPYPPNGCSAAPVCLTDEQLQTELRKYILANGLPQDLAHEYFLLSPPGVETCFEADGAECSAGAENGVFCAYHSAFSGTTGEIVYADDPYVTGNSGCESGQSPSGKPSEGALQGGLSHEHNESLTDPEPSSGWIGNEGQEIGDKCRTFVEASEFGTPLGTAPDGAPYNQVVDGHEYWYQQEWSNEGKTCLQRLGAKPPTITKLSVKTGPAIGGTPLTITGTHLSGATAVSFGATAAAEFHVISSTSISAVSPPGTSGVVEVSVSTEAGTSAKTSADHYTYSPPTITNITPGSGTKLGGTTVEVAGSGFALGSATEFLFGKAGATSVSCSSTTACSLSSPAAAKTGAVAVTAKVAGKTSKVLTADHYTYD